MNKEILTSKRMIFLMCMFLFGSTSILGLGSNVEQDTWIALLTAFVFVIPIIFMYGRIIRIFPGRDIFDMFQELFGGFFGKVLTIIFVWYCIHLGALILKNYSEFIVTLQMPETKEIALMIILIPCIIYISKKGVNCLSKWATIIFVIVLFVAGFTSILSLKHMDFQNILPIAEHGFKDMSRSALNIVLFPFGEIVLFLSFGKSFNKRDNPYKTYFIAVSIMVFLLLVLVLRNVLVLGAEMHAKELYESYSAVKVININESLSRFESTISLTFILSCIGKIVVCVLSASKGLSKLVKIDDYKAFVVPSSVLVLALCSTVYKNAIEMFAFLDEYPMYLISIQISIPLLVWIAAEIKMHKIKKLKPNPTPS